jgi:undecaprenyl-diphosphatase
MIEALILGIVHGITEFLPVSSTAHLIVLPWFFNWSGEVDTLTFDIALHAGTLIALLCCFWKDWLDLIVRKQKLFAMIFMASVPAGIAGIFLNDFIEKSMRSPVIISVMLIVVGIIMLISEKAYKYKNVDTVTFRDALIIGVAQAFAIIPGVSRSGITISAGLFRGLEREASARLSFLLSTPIIAGAVLLHGKKALGSPGSYDLKLFVVGLIASFFTGFIAIKFLMNFLKKYPLNVFVFYRFVLAVVIISGIWLKG